MILHYMRKFCWQECKTKEFWGEELLAHEGFIHCSTVEYFWRVAPNYKEMKMVSILRIQSFHRSKTNKKLILSYILKEHAGKKQHVLFLVRDSALYP